MPHDTRLELKQTVAALRRELEARTAERDEALARQSATSETFSAITRSPADVRPVFEAIVARAADLCEAEFSAVARLDEGLLHLVAINNMSPEEAAAFHNLYPRLATPGFAMGRAVIEGHPVHFADVLAEPDYDPRTLEGLQSVARYRSFLGVPIFRAGQPIGVIGCGRRQVKPFTSAQIALVETFADQAAIALENAGLLTELETRNRDLAEALEQQTATAEVLQIINSSPGDLASVFDAMLERAMALCGASFGGLSTYDGERFCAVATRGVSPALADFFRDPYTAGPQSYLGQLAGGETVLHIPDLAAAISTEEADPLTRPGAGRGRAFVELGNARTGLFLALRRERVLLGSLWFYRQEMRPFSEKQIALLQNFAAQTVIAMENARLLTETREALEQQTATAEVLQVINSSPGDLAPVFDAMLERAMRLCNASMGVFAWYDGNVFKPAVSRGVPPRYAEYLATTSEQPSPEGTNQRVLAGENVACVIDVMEGVGYRSGHSWVRALVELGEARSLMTVALRKDGALLGTITLYRREVRPFTGKQIALLENFAAQAVIAMENARLLTETCEALEQQTATAEVLQVINSSPGDLAPVFDAMLERAMRLCEAAFGMFWVKDGDCFRSLAHHGLPAELASFVERPVLNPPEGSALRRLIDGESVVHIADILTEPPLQNPVGARAALVELGGARTQLLVALRKDHLLIGLFHVYRREVRPFTDKQIALLQNFAAQAVIAMENARLLTETRVALEQQTATAQVLQVINSSPGDLQPVFQTILEKAHRLCDVSHGSLQLYDGEKFRAVAVHGLSGALADRLREGYSPGPNMPTCRLLEGEPFAHQPDLADVDDPMARSIVELGGTRTLLWVSLRRDDKLLGLIAAARLEVRPFTDKQIALLQNFAAQAVIAMENARLLTETREALEQQTATAEVLQVINSSPGDLAPVFDAILEKAHTLCDAALGGLLIRDGEEFRPIAIHAEPSFAEYWRQTPVRPPPEGDAPFAQLTRGARIVHVPDVRTSDAYRDIPIYQDLMNRGDIRTLLIVALRSDRAVLGAITAYRQEVQPFSEKQIALLQNFAAQAVIAMENARLLTETREALEQQTATAEVLEVINSSPGNLKPVFDAMLERAMRLCEAAFGVLWTYHSDRYWASAVRGAPPAFIEFLREPIRPPYHPSSGLGRMLGGEDLAIHNDMSMEEIYRSGDPMRRAIVDLGGARSAVTVSLRKDETLLGAFTVYRQEVRPFSGKQIALLQNFAAQAVIAMDNARLLDEIRQRQAELRVTFDNMADGVVMFDEDHRLTAWNRNFQEMLDLSDAVLNKRPRYADYIRILAERGEFGTEDIEAELSRRLEDIDKELRLERTRPDGRVIELRRNAVPEGGFVLIYSDITERKRSEAEIRAARDAAEAAYRDLKGAQASLIQAEKMASLGQLTAGIAHEIKNPLNFVNNFADLSVELLDELTVIAAPGFAALNDEQRADADETITMLIRNLETIAEHGRRADGIVKSMLEHSRGSSCERRSVDLNSLIEEALNLAYHGGRARDQSFNITLERDFAQAIAPIELVPQDITRVCLNLFGNGFYAAARRQREGDDPKFKPTLKVSTRDLGDAVEVAVRDNGTGIPSEIKDKLFQPFFTTKPTGEGTGLGLSISWDIITQQHGGTIEVDSREGEFTEFTIRLPRRAPLEAAERAE